MLIGLVCQAKWCVLGQMHSEASKGNKADAKLCATVLARTDTASKLSTQRLVNPQNLTSE